MSRKQTMEDQIAHNYTDADDDYHDDPKAHPMKIETIIHGPFQSKSDPNVSYTVMQLGKVYTCNCPGYTMNRQRAKSNTRYCVHLRKLGVPEPVAGPAGPQQQSLLGSPSEERFQPMLASALPEGKTIQDYMVDGYVMEQKFDGHRILVEVKHEPGKGFATIHAWSREGNQRMLPAHLNKALQQVPDVLLDTEMYVPGGTSSDVTDKQRFQELQMAVFDIVRIGHMDCCDVCGAERRKMLEIAMSKVEADCLHIAAQMVVNATTLQAMWDSGLEGVIVKHENARYQPGVRSKEWIKFKKLNHCETKIVAFKEGLLGPHSIIVAVHDDGTEVQVKSLNDEWRARFAKEAEKFIGATLVIDYTQRHTKSKKFQQPHADHILGW